MNKEPISLFEAIESNRKELGAKGGNFEVGQLSMRDVIDGLKSSGEDFIFKNKDEIGRAVGGASDSDFVDFLKFFAGYKFREALGVNIARPFISRGLKALEEGSVDAELYFFPALFPYNDESLDRGNSGRTSYFMHVALRAFEVLYQEYPKGSKEFLRRVVDGGDVIGPTVLVSTFADLLWKPYVDDDARRLMLHGINIWSSYWTAGQLSHNLGRHHIPSLPGSPWKSASSKLDNPLYRGLIDNLDFKDEKKYSRTLNVLNLIEKLAQWNYENSGNGGTMDGMEHLLGSYLSTNYGSYFLQIRLRDVYYKLLNYKYGDGDDPSGPRNRYLKLTNYGFGDIRSLEGDPHLKSLAQEAREKHGALHGAPLFPERSLDLAPGVRGLFKDGVLSLVRNDVPIVEKTERGKTLSVDGSADDAGEQMRQSRKTGASSSPITIDDVLPVHLSGVDEKKDGDLAADLRDYTYMITQDAIRDSIKNDFQISLSDIPLEEQFHFLQFIKHKEAREIDPVKNFVKSYGLPGLRTFLSLDYGKDLGDKIVALGNSLDHEAASAIFSKYGQIVDAVEAVRAYLGANFHQEETLTPEIVAKITDNLLRRGRDLLAHFADQTQEAKNGRKVLDPGNILDELQEIKTETLLFLSSFQTLKREGVDLDFAAIQDLDFGSMPARSLSPEDVSEMKAMYEKNYADNVEIRDDLLSVFAQAVTRENTVFYVLRYQGKIIGFVRFDDKGDGRLYAGSLNVHPQFRGSAIGEVVMEKTIDLKARVAILDADCSAIDSVGAHYIEAGFVANSFYDYKGDPSFKIERNDRVRYESKLMSKSDIVERYNHRSVDDRDMIITSSSAKDPVRLRFNLLNEGYLLTRYFQYPNGVKNAPWYCVFEPAVANHNVSAKTQAA